MVRGNLIFVGALLVSYAGIARAEGGKTGKAKDTTSAPAATATASMATMQGASNELAAIAYDRGAAAFDAKNYPLAAEEFSRADALAPNTLALQLALDSAMRSGRAALVMDLATRGQARLASPQSNAAASGGDRVALTVLISRAHAEYENRAGTLTIQCVSARTCSARVDDRPWPVNSRAWIGVGRHVLSMKIDGREERRDVVIPPREQIEVRPDPTATVAPPRVPTAPVAQVPSSKDMNTRPLAPENQGGNHGSSSGSRHGISPTWFWVGASTTAVLGGLAAASGIDTHAKHNEFELNRTADRASDGREAQTRTNVLLGLTAVGVVATATLAVFFVDWSHHRQSGRASTPRTTLGLGSCLTLTTTY